MGRQGVTVRTRVKICCMGSTDEVHLAVAEGADAVGVVGGMPSGPGVVDRAVAAAVLRATPPPVAAFLLTSETTADAIAAHVRRMGARVVQVVRHLDPVESARLADALPDVQVVQVIHVEGPDAVALIDRYADDVDAFLLDSGRPDAAVPELGGTGRVHDWAVSRAFVRASPRPVFLAGGLHPGNVAEAIRTVRPFGVDLCTGVRTRGALDPAKLRAFVAAVRAVDAEGAPMPAGGV